MQYKTLVLIASEADEDINMLAKEGWLVHSMHPVGFVEAHDTDSDDVVLTYLLQRSGDHAAPDSPSAPPRRFIGMKG